MNTDKFGKLKMIGLSIIVAQSLLIQSSFANNNMTEAQMYEFSNLPNKGNITSGFFQCKAKHQAKNPLLACLPDELTFQQNVLKSTYAEYRHTLSKEAQKELDNLRTIWSSFYVARCDFITKNSTRGIAKVNRYKCQLAMVLDWRLELENLAPNHVE